MKKLLIGVIAGIVVVTGGVWLLVREPARPEPGASSTVSLAPEIEEIVRAKTVFVEKLAADETIIELVRKANDANVRLSDADIAALDAKWRAAPSGDVFIGSFLTNETAGILTAFQEVHPEFPEVFVTDARGLNVGQTNKTSDFYQADEDWWQNTVRSDRAFHGPIEFDESALSEAISIYAPIFDPARRTTIGVVKAVLNIAAIKQSL